MKDDLFVLSTVWPSSGLDIPGLTLPKRTIIQLLDSNQKVTFTNINTGVHITATIVSPPDFEGKYGYLFKISEGKSAIAK